METVKDILTICNAAVFYDYKILAIIDEINPVRKCRINNFHEAILVDRILVSLSIIDVVIFKTNDNDTENVVEKVEDLKDLILYMLSFEKVVREKEAGEK